ncbi:putative p450 monooxygenase protein [Phaeoacremonium minimum UCRPA7]|uniref:Putative p450 monooxygenase protein n=1 Tax=Phaeoacremonium minimum (strain UCR-PA7) TaxID=1286976 RepID=R8BDK6_PHAM7|nr:putative p450 monooxygenase protein [Phaeoacremonium minimum UCRPA7]EON97386.1 putative p450 monooxygenase protein [Phaeoacremonium minimum UCRPA7]
MFSTYILFLLLGGVALTVVRLVLNSLQLRGIPGPWQAQFTDLWRFNSMRSKGWSARLIELHQKHGSLVRIGPKHVSISDPGAIPIIYGTSPVWLKGPSYYAAATVSQGRMVPSIIAMGELQHTAVRKSAGRAFTTNSLLDYEASIETSAAELIRVLGENPTTDIANWLQFFAMDVLMRIAFSESLGFMDKGDDVDGILAAVVGRFDHWNAWAALPGGDYLFNKGPLASMLRKQKDSPLARVGMTKLMARKGAAARTEKSDLLQKFLDGQAKYPDIVSDNEVLGIIMSTIGAGADTTAGTLAYTIYLLCLNPTAAQSLMSELQEALRGGTLTNPPKWSQVNRLPYLDAVLKESMRVFPIASWGLDRIVPATGATICGKYIPAGTIVGCQIDAIHLDEDVYGKDASEFRPERWIEASEDQKRRMDRAFLAFSAGKRTCTGIHIAWLEMKKVLPLILMNFEVR